MSTLKPPTIHQLTFRRPLGRTPLNPHKTPPSLQPPTTGRIGAHNIPDHVEGSCRPLLGDSVLHSGQTTAASNSDPNWETLHTSTLIRTTCRSGETEGHGGTATTTDTVWNEGSTLIPTPSPHRGDPGINVALTDDLIIDWMEYGTQVVHCEEVTHGGDESTVIPLDVPYPGGPTNNEPTSETDDHHLHREVGGQGQFMPRCELNPA